MTTNIEKQPTNKVAIFGSILSLMGLCTCMVLPEAPIAIVASGLFLCLPAAIMGYKARKEIIAKGGSKRDMNLAKIALYIGSIGVILGAMWICIGTLQLVAPLLASG